MLDRKDIEEYKGYMILQYDSEPGYRVDFGTMRSELVDTIEEARGLIDFALSTKEETELAEECVNCGNLKGEPIYILEDKGYCAYCLISKLSEKGILQIRGVNDGDYEITL